MSLLTFGTAGPTQAETFPITGTVHVETGMRKLATVTLVREWPTSVDRGAEVNWGDGTPVQRGWLVNCREFLNRTCDVYGTHVYRSLGTFEITIGYSSPGGLFPTWTEETTTAIIQSLGDFVIVSIGDSVASGEGNPVIPRFLVFEDTRVINQGLWDDPGSNYDYPDGHPERVGCHRSFEGGPALAGFRLQSTNPASNITFIHVACSGAGVNAGSVPSLETQLGNVRRSLEAARIQQGGRPDGPPINIDVLLLSGGANNIAGGFGKLVSDCILHLPGNPCSSNDELKEDMRESFARLPADYAKLAGEITTPSGDTRGTVSRVYITEYFDPTRDEEGNFPSLVRSLACVGGALNPAEWEFLYNEMVVPLNNAVMSASLAHGWHLVGGMAGDFRTHGYCAQPGPFALQGDSWVVKFPESLDKQGEQNGSAHPNLLGHLNYRDHILSTIFRFTPPRTTAGAVAGGHPYEFGTWTAQDVQVTLAAGNPISQSGVGRTFFAVNNPACSPSTVANCSTYAAPVVINTSGTHILSFFSENASGELEPANSVVVRIDKDPPQMTCGGTPPVLWPPNGRMVPVSTSVEAVDDVSGPVPFALTSVETSEGDPGGQVQGFVIGQPDTAGLLRAARAGSGHGRDYTLTYESMDALGNVGHCTVVIRVPHDQRRTGR